MYLSLSRHARLQAARITRKSGRQTWTRRHTSKQQNEARVDVSQTTTFARGEPVDPRPRWMFSAASLLRVVFIPTGLIYAVFIHDFGEREHVFMPPRRWLQRQKESFFTLSPAEKDLVKDNVSDDNRQPT